MIVHPGYGGANMCGVVLERKHDKTIFMLRDELIIHIGYPKAASTWLQKSILIEEFGFRTPWPTHDNAALEHFIFEPKARFDAGRIRETFFKACTEGGGAPFISHEALAGDPIAGRYYGYETADRLAASFPEAKIIIFFREQKAYAYSSWAEHIKRGGLTKIAAYLDDQNAPPGYRPFCPVEFLRFDDLIGYYVKLFGAANVLALPIEAIAGGKAVDHLAAYLNRDEIRQAGHAKVYKGLQGASIRLLQYLNRWSPYDPTQRTNRQWIMQQARRADRRLPKSLHEKCKREDKAQIAAILEGCFRQSNQRLQGLTPIDLAQFEYEL